MPSEEPVGAVACIGCDSGGNCSIVAQLLGGLEVFRYGDENCISFK